MRRTQIYLDKKIIRLLAKLSSQSGKTRSELIREALSEVYLQDDVKLVISKINGLRSFADFEMEKSKGSWTKLLGRKERKW